MENLDLRKDNDWSIIDSEPCRVIEFIPSASIQKRKSYSLQRNRTLCFGYFGMQKDT